MAFWSNVKGGNVSKSPKPFHRKEKKPYSKFNDGIPSKSFYGNISTTQSNPYATDSKVAYACLISEHRFEVNLGSYIPEAVEIFKTVPSHAYNPTSKKWSFDMKDYNFLFEKLKAVQSKVVVNRIPEYVLRCLQLTYDSNDVIDYSKVERKLFNVLFEFQKETLRFAIHRNGRLLIADEMGLGKTLQSLAIASYYRSNWPLLIVATKSMRNQWYETIMKYFMIPSMHIQLVNMGKDEISEAKIVIITHELMSRCITKLKDRYFGVLIIDESHIVKNPVAKVTQHAIELSKLARRVILLSGTPALSRPSELYSQLSMIDDYFFPNYYKFTERYSNGMKTIYGWNASGSTNLAELEVILSKKFMIRRTKEKLFLQLPNISRDLVKLDQKLCADDIKSLNMLAEDYQTADNKHRALLGYFVHTAKVKTIPVCLYLTKVFNENVKFLVFAHHQVMMNAIESLVKSLNKKFIKIDGHTSTDDRKTLVDTFQEDNEYVCAILSLTAANTGITLTAAQLVIFAELYWNPTVLSQAECRAHRLGQEQHVTVRYLMADGTADDLIWPMLQSKRQTLNEIGLFDGSCENFDQIEHDGSALPSTQHSIDVEDLLNSIDDECLKDVDESVRIEEGVSTDKQDVANIETTESSCNDKENYEQFFNDDVFDNLDSIDF